MTIGLKTATDKDLVKRIEDAHNKKEAQKAALAEQEGGLGVIVRGGFAQPVPCLDEILLNAATLEV